MSTTARTQSGLIRNPDGTYSASIVQGLEVPGHDYIQFNPAATPATGSQDVIFKLGGSAGTTVATLTLTYSSGNLVSVAKS
jgi:hypothetical protein